jgi:phenylacetate-CoA ligase
MTSKAVELINNFKFHGTDIQRFDDGQIKKLQTELFKDQIDYIAGNSPFYKEHFKRHGIDASQIIKTDDLHLIPPTSKEDLIHYNRDFLAVADEEVIDVCLTSATSGEKPAMLLQNHSDLIRLAYNEEIAFAMTGLMEKDTLLICAALDRAFMAGLAYFLGGSKLNIRLVRSGSGSAAQHWQMLKVTNATAIVGVPSLMRKIAEYGLECGEQPRATAVKKLIAIGEPTRDGDLKLLPLTKKLEEMWDAEIYSTYASTELATTYCECQERQGGHVRPELIITEILDDNDNPLLPGEQGEVVVTPLGVTGMPLLRFKTGDISYIIDAPCACGRTTQRIAPVLGRKKQMLKFKGTTIFPNAILAALEGAVFFDEGYVEVKRNPDGTDHVILHLCLKENAASKSQIEDHLRARIRVVPEINIKPKEDILKIMYQPDKKRKRITFVDSRLK